MSGPNPSPAFGAWLNNPPPHSIQTIQPVFSAVQRGYIQDCILRQQAISMQQQQQRDRELYQLHQQRQQQQQQQQTPQQPFPAKTPPSPHSPDQKPNYQPSEPSTFLADYVLTLSVPNWPEVTLIYYPNGSIHVLCGGEAKGQFNTTKRAAYGQGYRYNVVSNPLVTQVLRNDGSGDIQYSANGGFGVSFIEDVSRRGYSLGPERGVMLGSTGGWGERAMTAEDNVRMPEVYSRMPPPTVNGAPILRKLSKEEFDALCKLSDTAFPSNVPLPSQQTKEEHDAAHWLGSQRSSTLGGSTVGCSEIARWPVTNTEIDRKVQAEWNAIRDLEEVQARAKDHIPHQMSVRHIEEKPSESSAPFNDIGTEESPREVEVNSHPYKPAVSSNFEEGGYEQENLRARAAPPDRRAHPGRPGASKVQKNLAPSPATGKRRTVAQQPKRKRAPRATKKTRVASVEPEIPEEEEEEGQETE
ncbi:hypothetical protein K440DRAFT_658868 [Wilcoxina mikolae CBS 423.85]|nr:hypothetical protein K440DRAFT_658868 [Wilcoxina mikolae CBS 423.85]